MSDSDWIHAGEGLSPVQSWAFRLESPLVDLQIARESGEVLAADDLGGMYRLNRGGQLTSLSRSFKHLRMFALADTGRFGAGLLGADTLCRFDAGLQTRWTMQLPSKASALAIDPFGHVIAVSLDQAETMVINEHKQTLVAFHSVRPLHFLRFVSERRELIGAANYGVLLRHSLAGDPLWQETLLCGVGDVAIPGDGELSYLAGFNHGVQVFDSYGENHAAYVVRGTPHLISTSYDGELLIVATQENYLYRMNPLGELLWAAEAPESIVRVHCDPLERGFVCGFKSGRVVRLDW